MVLMLTVLAASPAFHAWLHADTNVLAKCGHDHGTTAPSPLKDREGADDAGCVVTLFAQGGAELAFAPALLAAPPLRVLRDSRPSADFCAPSAPAHLLPPGCGPPLAE